MLLLVNRRLGLRGLYLIFAFVFYFCYCKTSTFKYFPEHTEKNIYIKSYIFIYLSGSSCLATIFLTALSIFFRLCLVFHPRSQLSLFICWLVMPRDRYGAPPSGIKIFERLPRSFPPSQKTEKDGDKSQDQSIKWDGATFNDVPAFSI